MSRSQIKHVRIQVKNAQVRMRKRKLKVTWTPELAQDLNAFHSIDAEDALMKKMSQSIAEEIDKEILDGILKTADGQKWWDSLSEIDKHMILAGYEVDGKTKKDIDSPWSYDTQE